MMILVTAKTTNVPGGDFLGVCWCETAFEEIGPTKWAKGTERDFWFAAPESDQFPSG